MKRDKQAKLEKFLLTGKPITHADAIKQGDCDFRKRISRLRIKFRKQGRTLYSRDCVSSDGVWFKEHWVK